MRWADFVEWTDNHINHRWLRYPGHGGNTISEWWCDLHEFYVGQCPPRFENGWLMRRRRKASR